MSRKSIAPQSRRHIWIFDDDWAFIESRFGKMSRNGIGTSEAIRRIIQAWVKNLKAKELAQIEAEKQIKDLEQ